MYFNLKTQLSSESYTDVPDPIFSDIFGFGFGPGP
jgi:hypothetical protein